MSRRPRPTTLYRLFTADGGLLYVGISDAPLTRMIGHSTDKPWWGDAATIRLEHFADRPAAIAAEATAIKAEDPQHNIAHTRRDPRRKQTPEERAEQKAAERAAREAEREAEEEALRVRRLTEYDRHNFTCEQCGMRPEWLPKGTPAVDLDCPNCGCVALHDPKRLRVVA